MQGPSFKLADALFCQVKLAADLYLGMAAFARKSEAQLQNPTLTRVQFIEDPSYQLLDVWLLALV